MVLVEKQPEPIETGQDVGRKKAYHQRKNYRKHTIAMDRQQKRAYNANRRANWTDDMKNAWKQENSCMQQEERSQEKGSTCRRRNH